MLLPLLAVTVMVVVPKATPEVAVIVIVETPPPGAGRLDGLNEAVTPAGKPLADSETAELNPPVTLVVTVMDVEVPGCTLTEAGVVTEKSGTGQLFTRLVALSVPIPVAKSQPVVVP